MDSLLSQVKNAKITTREVLVYLRKKGDLRRKKYAYQLRKQYLTAGDTYQALQSASENQQENLNTPNTPVDKKLTMPLHLTKSNLVGTNASFENRDFLTEAWHFFLKESHHAVQCDLHANSDNNHKTEKEFAENLSTTTLTTPTQKADPTLLHNTTHELQLHYAKTTQSTLTDISGFGKSCLFNTCLNNTTPLCVQILQWAQEGKLILN